MLEEMAKGRGGLILEIEVCIEVIVIYRQEI